MKSYLEMFSALYVDKCADDLASIQPVPAVGHELLIDCNLAIKKIAL